MVVDKIFVDTGMHLVKKVKIVLGLGCCLAWHGPESNSYLYHAVSVELLQFQMGNYILHGSKANTFYLESCYHGDVTKY